MECKFRVRNASACAKVEEIFVCGIPCATWQRISPLQLRLNNHFSHHAALVCEPCAEAGCTPADLKRYTCTNSDCGKELGCRSSDKMQLNNYNKRGGVLLCKECRKSQAACRSEEASRLRALRKQAATSKRKGCTCDQRIGHAEKCPMHARTFGEKPYPWCDVMTRRDSDWLQTHSKKRKV